MNWSTITTPQCLREQLAQEPAMSELPASGDHTQQATIKKAMMLRRWAMSMASYSGREYLLPGFGQLGLIEQLQALATYQHGVWCGDAAAWYVNVLRCFHIPATRFFYGHDEEGLGGLSHVTVIVGYNVGKLGEPYDFEFAIIDPYLGFHYEDAATGRLMPVHVLIPRVIRGEYDTIRRVDTELVRPYLADPDEEHGYHGWLFPSGKQPVQGELHGDRMVYQGASHSVAKLFPPGSPMWKLAAEKRGGKSLKHYLLDLMLVRPRFEDILPRLATEKAKEGDRYAEHQFFRVMIQAVMGAQ